MKTSIKIKEIIQVAVLTAVLGACTNIPKSQKAAAPVEAPAVVAAPVAAASDGFKQIERLARPAINEGLVISNDFLNAFNSIPPTADLSPAAAPVVAQAASVLTAVFNYASTPAFGLNPKPVGDVAGGFLPDVMRIDTRNTVAVDKWAYNSDFVIVEGTSGAAILTGGRKIADDVMDITFSYLFNSNPICGPGTASANCDVGDGVSYAGTAVGSTNPTSCAQAGAGSNLGNPGHKCLVGQTSRDGNAIFPFLASPH